MLQIDRQEEEQIGATFSSIERDIYMRYEIEKDGEIFEKLIFDLMLNKYSDHEEKEFILALPKEKKRMGMLALIDGDNVLWTKMNAFVNECTNKQDHNKDVLKIISRFVKDGEVERKKYGEVMTPISLIRSMLQHLPSRVWSDPTLKWLDPTNGAGTFPHVVIYFLMKGLEEWEPDTEKRYRHIVENMIHTCEIQSRNVFLWLVGVDPKDEYTTNAYWGSYLDEGFDYHMKNVWGVDKFDIIIGNPPYQKQVGPNKTEAIWGHFVEKSFSICKEGGIVSLIHPSAWRNAKSKFDGIKNLILSKNMLYLSVNDFNKGKEVFGVGTNFDWYVVENRPAVGATMVTDVKGKTSSIEVSGLEFIPNGSFEEIIPLIAKEGEEKVNLLFDRTSYGNDKANMSKSMVGEFTHPCVYTITQKNGINLWYSSERKGHFGIPKVIWSNGLGTYPIVDAEGAYGITNFAAAIVDSPENLEGIRAALASDKFLKLMQMIKFKNDLYDYRVISTFKRDFWKQFS